MERLTFVTEDGKVLFHPADLPDDEGMTITQLAENGRYKDLEEIAERLANREQAEEQGLLLRLSCKPESEVFLICSRYTHCSFEDVSFEESSCEGCRYDCDSQNELYIHRNSSVDIEWITRNINKFGKTVFLTGEEAKAKLKEMGAQMENRFLFRAKRIGNGEWVEGFLVPFAGGDKNRFWQIKKVDDIEKPSISQTVRVNPSTICQCTGHKDKNGNLIWENDIIKNDKGNLYKAFWQDDHYQFSWVCVKSEKLPIGAKWNFDCFRGYEIEIIGNAFDNPELLEMNLFQNGNS